MKRIILDYLRRWRWAWLLIIFLQGAGNIILWMQKQSEISFCIGGFMGALLLSFELLRQPVRSLLCLPVRTRELGRAWWCVTVLVPGIILTLIAVLSYCVMALVLSDFDVSLVELAIHVGMQWAFLGLSLAILTFVHAGPNQGFKQNAIGALAGGLWGLCIPAMLFLPGIMHKTDSMLIGIFLCVGIASCIADLWLVEGLVHRRLKPLGNLKRATMSDERLTLKESSLKKIMFLLAHSFKTTFVFGAWMFFVMLVVWHLFGIGLNKSTGRLTEESYRMMMMSIMTTFWCISAMMNMGWIISIRSLRVLPIPTTRLALMLLGISAMPSLVFLIMNVIVSLCFAVALYALSLKLAFVLAGAGALVIWPVLRFGLNWKTYSCLAVGMMCFVPFSAQLKHIQIVHSSVFLAVTWAIVYVLVYREVKSGSTLWKASNFSFPSFQPGIR